MKRERNRKKQPAENLFRLLQAGGFPSEKEILYNFVLERKNCEWETELNYWRLPAAWKN